MHEPCITEKYKLLLSYQILLYGTNIIKKEINVYGKKGREYILGYVDFTRF